MRRVLLTGVLAVLAVVVIGLLVVGARHVTDDLHALRCHLPDWGPLHGDSCVDVRRAP